MAKDTTKTGVSDDQETKVDRDNDINDIVANRKQAREMEEAGVDMNNPMEVTLAKQKIADGKDPDPNAGKSDPDEVGDPDLEAQKNEDELDKTKNERVLVKINGMEKMALKSEVDAEGGVVAYQKNRSADEKMRQAADMRKQNEHDAAILKQKELDLAKQEEALLNKQNNTDQLSDKDASPVSEEAKALRKKMYSGDEDKTDEAIQVLLDAGKQPATQKVDAQPVDTQAIVDEAVARVQWQNDLKSATAMFASEYSDINNNPEYREYADQATLQIKAENPSWTPTQIIREAGEQSRLKFADPLRENDRKVEDENRLNNKRATDNVKSADAKVQKKPEKRAKTQSEIVQDMQKNRSHSPA